MEEILSLVNRLVLVDLQPNSHDEVIRNQGESWVNSTLTSGISCKAFATAAKLSKVLLFDETLEVTQVFPKSQAVNWCQRATESLILEAAKQTETRLNDTFVESISLGFQHNWVEAVVNKVKFRVMPNNLQSLFFCALLEEMNAVIGSGSLLKKSILLIKAWCAYETKRFSHLSFSKVFTHESICVMVMWLFVTQTQEETIQHPLHALMTFLSVFSDFEWDSLAISSVALQPLTHSLRSKTCTALRREAASVAEDSRASPHTTSTVRRTFSGLVDRYRERYEAHSSKDRSQSGSAGKQLEGVAAMSSSFTDFSLKPSSAVHKPQRETVTVLDPITGDKNLLSHVFTTSHDHNSANLPAELQRMFTGGHKECCAFMQRVSADSTEADLSTILPFTIAASSSYHSQYPQTDALLLGPLGSEKLVTSLNDILGLMGLGESTIMSKITGEVIIKLVTQVLQQNGPMPIGEIGKQLQTMTGNANLPKVLKKAFNGLKSFITTQSHIFRMGDNHDFNPYVYLVLGGAGVGGKEHEVAIDGETTFRPQAQANITIQQQSPSQMPINSSNYSSNGTGHLHSAAPAFQPTGNVYQQRAPPGIQYLNSPKLDYQLGGAFRPSQSHPQPQSRLYEPHAQNQQQLQQLHFQHYQQQQQQQQQQQHRLSPKAAQTATFHQQQQRNNSYTQQYNNQATNRSYAPPIHQYRSAAEASIVRNHDLPNSLDTHHNQHQHQHNIWKAPDPQHNQTSLNYSLTPHVPTNLGFLENKSDGSGHDNYNMWQSTAPLNRTSYAMFEDSECSDGGVDQESASDY